MNKSIALIISFLLVFISCDNFSLVEKGNRTENSLKTVTPTSKINVLTDFESATEDGHVNAVIEIPAGTLEKWELNKSSGQLVLESINALPRIVNYLGYPGNYGMIPRTLLSKEKGGDGDPLDIIVLGPPVERGRLVKCKIIGVLYLKDSGEQDDKLLAVSIGSPLYDVGNIDELNEHYIGINEIIELWFTNYKGPNKIKSLGFGNRDAAYDILNVAIKDYELNDHK